MKLTCYSMCIDLRLFISHQAESNDFFSLFQMCILLSLYWQGCWLKTWIMNHILLK